MPTTFPVPAAYRELDLSPERQAWIDTLPATAESLAERWGLAPDGEPMSGFLSTVWPVRDPAGRRLAMKIHSDHRGTEGEWLALDVARGPALVELVEADPSLNALLLERLDHERLLVGAPIDEACEVIGDLVAEISAHDAPPAMRPMADELDHIRETILAKKELAAVALPWVLIDRALDTLAGLAAELRAGTGPLPLVHADCHYENVLHTLPGEPPRWVAIDPLPMAGYPELEVVAALRNRWADAATSDDPERALWRRLDIICERAGLDRARAVAMAQASAVDNVMWLSIDESAHPIAKEFLHPYSIIAHW